MKNELIAFVARLDRIRKNADIDDDCAIASEHLYRCAQDIATFLRTSGYSRDADEVEAHMNHREVTFGASSIYRLTKKVKFYKTRLVVLADTLSEPTHQAPSSPLTAPTQTTHARRLHGVSIIDESLARLAIQASKVCVSEKGKVSPLVGAVLVKDGNVLGTAYRGELKAGEHAEYTLLERMLQSAAVAGATLYTTLEPCTHRNHPKLCCAQRIIDRKIACVFIGILDPNHVVCGKGQRMLHASGIETQLFPRHLADEIEDLNRAFIRDCHSRERLFRVDVLRGELSTRIQPLVYRLSRRLRDLHQLDHANAGEQPLTEEKQNLLALLEVVAHRDILNSVKRFKEQLTDGTDGAVQLDYWCAEYEVRVRGVFPGLDSFSVDDATACAEELTYAASHLALMRGSLMEKTLELLMLLTGSDEQADAQRSNPPYSKLATRPDYT